MPEQIANMPYGKKLPSFKTIYHWIDEQYLTCNTENIASEGKNTKKAGNRELFPTGKKKERKRYISGKSLDIGNRTL